MGLCVSRPRCKFRVTVAFPSAHRPPPVALAACRWDVPGWAARTLPFPWLGPAGLRRARAVPLFLRPRVRHATRAGDAPSRRLHPPRSQRCRGTSAWTWASSQHPRRLTPHSVCVCGRGCLAPCGPHAPPQVEGWSRRPVVSTWRCLCGGGSVAVFWGRPGSGGCLLASRRDADLERELD